MESGSLIRSSCEWAVEQGIPVSRGLLKGLGLRGDSSLSELRVGGIFRDVEGAPSRVLRALLTACRCRRSSIATSQYLRSPRGVGKPVSETASPSARPQSGHPQIVQSFASLCCCATSDFDAPDGRRSCVISGR
jgi:hypothetical protein